MENELNKIEEAVEECINTLLSVKDEVDDRYGDSPNPVSDLICTLVDSIDCLYDDFEDEVRSC